MGDGWKERGRKRRKTDISTDRNIDISGYRRDSIEEAGMQKGNKKEWRKPIYLEIDKSTDRTGNRYIEISRNRYIEGEKKRIKQTINNKQHYKTIKYYAEDTAIWIFLVEYLGGGECYSIGDTGVLQEISELEE